MQRLSRLNRLYSVHGLLALLAVGFGLALLLQNDTFARSEAFSPMEQWARAWTWGDELTWGTYAVGFGVLHIIALLRSMPRLGIASWIALLMFWVFLAGALWSSSTWTTGLPIYSIVALYALWSCIQDDDR